MCDLSPIVWSGFAAPDSSLSNPLLDLDTTPITLLQD